MKTNPIATLAAVLSAAVLVTAPSLAQAATAKKAVKSVKASKAKPRLSAKINPNHRTNLRSSTKNVAAGITAAEVALTPAELALAERVHVGQMPCELGASVTVTPDPKMPGYFQMQGRNFNYRMFPVLTSTGAVRLEDPKAGAVWLQLGNKSMLMNQKQGVRLADECMSPAQSMVAQTLKINPAASLLDPVRPAALPASPPAFVPGQPEPVPADALMQLVPAAR